MTALIIPIDDAWFHRLRRDMAREWMTRLLAADVGAPRDDMAQDPDRVIVLQREDRNGLPCDVERERS